ncbi:S8 family serine peptidase [Nocardia yamanashiensis]|uniref:S8 family serine peptidase n=1 Tax=Nocardia yamanashiensis TaxID=209247 RepID=UPI0014713415|nr:S8 family serine peptidase [Nocardia yamanashiensis]
MLPVVALSVLAASALPAAAAPPDPKPLVEIQRAPASDKVTPRPGEYIVIVKSGESVDDVLADANVKPDNRWTPMLNGFGTKLTPNRVEALQRDSRVESIIENAAVSTKDTPSAKALTASAAPDNWALDRINQANLPLDGVVQVNSTGAGVRVYVIDDGIDLSHPDFGGRASNGSDHVGGTTTPACFEHGTEVAGVIGGTRYGVAKQAQLVSVRVGDCAGQVGLIQFLNGVNWVRTNHQSPAVANISSNFEYWVAQLAGAALRQAVNSLADSGVFVAVSAGNDHDDACHHPPADAAGGFAVAHTDFTDSRDVQYANYGTCVQMYAPGDVVDVPIPGGNYGRDSGSSFAAPLAAGVAALYKATYGDASWQTIRDWLIDKSTKNVVQNNNTGSYPTPNRLLNTGGL